MNSLQTIQTLIPPDFIDLGTGDPNPRILPLEMLHDAAAHRLGLGEREFLQYGLEQGDGHFRAALARFLSAHCGFHVSHDELFTTAGISSALALICSLFTKPGDVIFVEEPSYFLALRIFADYGLRVASIRTDESGLVIDDLVHALSGSKPKFVYIVPTFQNPSGHTFPQERREQLVDLAKQHDFLILADEVYQFLSYTQTPPKSFGAYIDSEKVISLGSFSKILAPGLRLGWLQTHASIMQRIITCGMLDSGGGMNPFTSAIVRSLIESGGLEQNISDLINIFGHRVRAMDGLLRKHIPQAQFSTPHGGYFFWLHLPGVDTSELRQQAKANKVDLRPGILFSSRSGLKEYFRLSVSYYDEDRIEEGILRLKHCFEK
jgi:DNA-binding transcriptional MocR family regulator